jgi:hypothetical protein
MMRKKGEGKALCRAISVGLIGEHVLQHIDIYNNDFESLLLIKIAFCKALPCNIWET